MEQTGGVPYANQNNLFSFRVSRQRTKAHRIVEVMTRIGIICCKEGHRCSGEKENWPLLKQKLTSSTDTHGLYSTPRFWKHEDHEQTVTLGGA